MQTMEQKNIETVTAFIEAFWNKSDMECTDRFLSDDYQELAYESKEGLKRFAGKILALNNCKTTANFRAEDRAFLGF